MPKKKKTESVDDLFDALENNEASKGKSKTPIHEIENKEDINRLFDWAESKRKESGAKTHRTTIQERLVPVLGKIFDETCQRERTLLSSVKFVATKDKDRVSCTFTHKAKCCDMKDSSDKTDLETIYGDEFDDYFRDDRSFTVNTATLTNDQVIDAFKALQKIFGAKYKNAVKPGRNIVPTEAFYRDRVLDPHHQELAQRAAKEGLAVLHAPVIKLS